MSKCFSFPTQTKMRSSLLIISLLLVSSCYRLMAQKTEQPSLDTLTKYLPELSQPIRIEFSYYSNKDNTLIPIGEDGLILIKDSEKREKKLKIWDIICLDTLLQEQWKIEIPVKRTENLIGYDYVNEELLLLIGKYQHRGQFRVLKVDRNRGVVKEHNLKLPVDLNLSHLSMVRHGIVFGGTSFGRPVLVFYDLLADKPVVVSGIYNVESRLLGIETSEKYGLFSVLINEVTKQKDYSISIKVYDLTGQLVYSNSLKTEAERSLIDATTTSYPDGTQFVSGTYSDDNKRSSIGFYVAKIQGGEQQFIKYYPFSELENFYNYLSAKKSKRIKNRAERKRIRGKKLKQSYSLLVHDIIKKNEEFVLIGEAYYPRYASMMDNSFMSTGSYSSSSFASTQTVRVLLGYQFTHAIMVGFDNNGEVQWDNSFGITKELKTSLEENVDVSIQPDNIIIFYVEGNEINAKAMNRKSELSPEMSIDIRLSNLADKLVQGRSETQGIVHWYRTNHLVYGHQKIKYTQVRKKKDRSRNVFFINLLRID